MANRNKAKGTRAETKVVRFLCDNGLDAERLALKGSKDEGDIRVKFNPCWEARLEVKSGKQTENPSRSMIEEWVRQGHEEGANAKLRCFLVIAGYGKQPKNYLVIDCIDEDHMRKWCYLDEFVDYLKSFEEGA